MGPQWTDTSTTVNCCYQEMLVRTSSREPSASLMLAWEDVSAGGVVTSDLWAGDVVAVTVEVFSWEDCLDLQLEVSVIA